MGRRRSFHDLTVTVEPDVARWARQQAASGNTSVSRLVGELLKERMRYEAAMQRALARRPFLKTDGRYLAREHAHERSRLR